MLFPIRVPSTFRIIAHRGASAYAPENTLPAFELALRMNRPQVELDTQLTTDGQIALCHDSSLARYGHGDRLVESLAWRELAELDMGSWFSPHLYGGVPMITLSQLFQHFGNRLFYHIELKGKAAELPAAVHQAITEAGLRDACIITSFSYDALVAMRAIDAGLPLGWLVHVMDSDTFDQSAALSLHQLCPLAAEVASEQVAAAREVVAEVRAWGLMGAHPNTLALDVAALIQRVLEAGCDGMTINWPDWATYA